MKATRNYPKNNDNKMQNSLNFLDDERILKRPIDVKRVNENWTWSLELEVNELEVTKWKLQSIQMNMFRWNSTLQNSTVIQSWLMLTSN